MFHAPSNAINVSSPASQRVCFNSLKWVSRMDEPSAVNREELLACTKAGTWPLHERARLLYGGFYGSRSPDERQREGVKDGGRDRIWCLSSCCPFLLFNILLQRGRKLKGKTQTQKQEPDSPPDPAPRKENNEWSEEKSVLKFYWCWWWYCLLIYWFFFF